MYTLRLKSLSLTTLKINSVIRHFHEIYIQLINTVLGFFNDTNVPSFNILGSFCCRILLTKYKRDVYDFSKSENIGDHSKYSPYKLLFARKYLNYIHSFTHSLTHPLSETPIY